MPMPLRSAPLCCPRSTIFTTTRHDIIIVNVGSIVNVGLLSCADFGGGQQTQVNLMNKPLTSEFITLHLKGRTDGFALKGGDATTGNLSTMWDGLRPNHTIAKTCQQSDEKYQPMRTYIYIYDIVIRISLQLPGLRLGPFC
jgi:hypothetical protein